MSTIGNVFIEAAETQNDEQLQECLAQCLKEKGLLAQYEKLHEREQALIYKVRSSLWINNSYPSFEFTAYVHHINGNITGIRLLNENEIPIDEYIKWCEGYINLLLYRKVELVYIIQILETTPISVYLWLGFECNGQEHQSHVSPFLVCLEDAEKTLKGINQNSETV